MKAAKGFLLLILHLLCTLAVQYVLLRLMLLEKSLNFGLGLRCVLLCLAVCMADLTGSAFLLRGNRMKRYGYIALQFWDLLLMSPVFLLALVGLFSGGDGTGYGILALCLELLLVVERSTTFVLFDPSRDRKTD